MTGAMCPESTAARRSIDGEVRRLVLFVANHIQRKTFGDFFEDALGLLGLLEEIGDLGGGGDFDFELFVEEETELVDGGEVAGVGEGDFEGSGGGSEPRGTKL